MKKSIVSIFAVCLAVCLCVSCDLKELPKDFCQNDFVPYFSHFVDFATVPPTLRLTDSTTNIGESPSATFKWYLDDKLIGSDTVVNYIICQQGDYRIRLEILNCSGIPKDTTMIISLPYPKDTITTIPPIDISGDDIGTKIIQAPDGGYIVCGISSNNGLWHPWYDKINSEGQRLWQFGPQVQLGQGEFRDIIPLSNGNYLLCGTANPTGNNQQIVVVEINKSSGDIIEPPNYYGGTDKEWGYSIRKTGDGFVIAGCTKSGLGTSNEGDMYLLKLNSNRDSIWSTSNGGLSFDFAYSVLETSSDKFIVCGTNDGNAVAYFVDSSSIDVWEQTYPFNTPGVFGSIIPTKNENHYVLAGYTYNNIGGDKDTYIVEINKSGVGQNFTSQPFIDPNDDEVYSIIETSEEDGFIVVGYTTNPSTGLPNAHMAKIDKDGNFVWAPDLETDFFQRAASVVEAPNCQLLILGTTSENGNNGTKDILLFKTLDRKI